VPYASSQSGKILVVEDDRDTRVLIDYLLRTHWDVTLTPSAPEALQVATDPETSVFDLFLIDVGLPSKQDGLDLIHTLRHRPETQQIPAVAVTAHVLPGDREQFLQAGFDAYIPKPFSRTRLIQTIQTTLPVELSS